MRVLRVLVWLIAGFWIMAAGGMLGGGVDATPTITTSAIGCLVSTTGLGLYLAGLAVGKSKAAMRVAVGLSVFAILYGFFSIAAEPYLSGPSRSDPNLRPLQGRDLNRSGSVS